MSDYRDPTPIDTEPTTKPIPERIKKLTQYVRTKMRGKDTREAMAQAAEEAGAISLESMGLSEETKGRQDYIEKRYDIAVGAMTEDAEVKDSRLDAEGVEYVNLKKRLDTEQKKVSEQLAHIVNQRLKFVTYDMFGAKADGINDDGVAIKQAHEYANLHNLPINNPTGEYWIKGTRNIPVMTNVEWGNTIFHIDENLNLKDKPVFYLKDDDSINVNLDATTKASVISKLKRGVKFIEELASYKNNLVFVVDSNTINCKRNGGGGQSWYKEEFFLVEEGGAIIGDLAWNFDNYTEMIAYPAEKSYLTIDGGTFLLNAKSTTNSAGTYVFNGFLLNRSRTIVKNQWVGLESGVIDNSTDAMQGFYYFEKAFDITLENIRINPRYTESDTGTYGIGGNRVLNLTLRNITSDGTNSHWGVLGTNLLKNVYVENCRLHRFDAHYHCWHLYMDNTDIGVGGITVTGGGDLFLENVTRMQGNALINFRRDYGARWDGDICVQDCRLQLISQYSQARIFDFSPDDFDHIYNLVFGRTIKVDGFVFDYTGAMTNNEVTRLMFVPDFSRNNNDPSKRIAFPRSLIFKNVFVRNRERGVRLIEIADPTHYKLHDKGVFDEGNGEIITNCNMIFENINVEKTSELAQTSNASVYLGVMAGGAYTDDYSLYPKIKIVDCGYIRLSINSSIAKIYTNNCILMSIDGYDGKSRSNYVFEDCIFQPIVKHHATANAYQFSTWGEVVFKNCVFDQPIIDGVLETDSARINTQYTSIYAINFRVSFIHIGSRLSKKFAKVYVANGNTPNEAFLRKLMSQDGYTLPTSV